MVYSGSIRSLKRKVFNSRLYNIYVEGLCANKSFAFSPHSPCGAEFVEFPN